MRIRNFLELNALLSLPLLASAHGGAHEQIVVAPDADWATRHLAEEHHISNFDAGTFFTLHDFASNGFWSPDDIKRTYGLMDPSASNVPQSKHDEVVNGVLALFDKDRSGTISYAEFLLGSDHGLKLPDFGLGPGHHGDDEYEYEIHHWEKYHGEDTKEEDLVHPEDIAHFKHHEEMEAREEELERRERQSIIVENIPAKFIRQ